MIPDPLPPQQEVKNDDRKHEVSHTRSGQPQLRACESDQRADLPTNFQRYAKGAAEIQKRCACIRWDSRECIYARYCRTMDDVERGAFDDADDDCECHCHDELRELEEDIYGVID